MTPLTAALVFGAGVAAGTMNVVVGAGTLLTFPALLALGIPPVVANVSNSVGLVPASVTGAYGYRRELAGRWGTVARLAVLSLLGGAAGALLLLALPADAFELAVPFLLLLAAVLTAVQPRVARWVRSRRGVAVPAGAGERAEGDEEGQPPLRVRPALALCVLATGVYGGYFGAAQGVILLALLGVLLTSDMQVANGVKNVLTGSANLASAVLFAVDGQVNWAVAGLIAVGSAIGGVIGARVGRSLPAGVLRGIIIVVATGAAVILAVRRVA